MEEIFVACPHFDHWKELLNLFEEDAQNVFNGSIAKYVNHNPDVTLIWTEDYFTTLNSNYLLNLFLFHTCESLKDGDRLALPRVRFNKLPQRMLTLKRKRLTAREVFWRLQITTVLVWKNLICFASCDGCQPLPEAQLKILLSSALISGCRIAHIVTTDPYEHHA